MSALTGLTSLHIGLWLVPVILGSVLSLLSVAYLLVLKHYVQKDIITYFSLHREHQECYVTINTWSIVSLLSPLYFINGYRGVSNSKRALITIVRSLAILFYFIL